MQKNIGSSECFLDIFSAKNIKDMNFIIWYRKVSHERIYHWE